jgi:hypothetical protein
MTLSRSSRIAPVGKSADSAIPRTVPRRTGRAFGIRARALAAASRTDAGNSTSSWTERILYGALLALVVLGLAAPGEYHYNLAPAGPLLELVLLGSAALLASRVSKGAWSILVLGALYVFLKTLLLVLYSPASIEDFLQAYKSFFYLIALAFFVGKKVFQGRRLAQFTALLVGAFLLKYGYSVVLGLAARPGIYMENNFELIMLMGLVYLAWPYLGTRRDLVFIGLAATVLLSGSRSAALALLVVYVFLYVRTSNRTWPLHIAGVAAVGYAVFTIFTSRLDGQGLQSIDRLNFLEVFLREVERWPIWEFLTGSLPLTPLSPGGCGSLSFYAPLFSATDPGVCYSVILHSFVLRALFDHGVIGLVLLYTLVWLGLRRSGVQVRDAVALLSLITVSAFSVSAFNNVFTAILLAIAMGLDRSAPPESAATAPGRPHRSRLRRAGRRPVPGERPRAPSLAAAVRRRVAGAQQ